MCFLKLIPPDLACDMSDSSLQVLVLTFDAVLAVYSFPVDGGRARQGDNVLTSPVCEQRVARWHTSTCAMAFHAGETETSSKAGTLYTRGEALGMPESFVGRSFSWWRCFVVRTVGALPNSPTQCGKRQKKTGTLAADPFAFGVSLLSISWLPSDTDCPRLTFPLPTSPPITALTTRTSVTPPVLPPEHV